MTMNLAHDATTEEPIRARKPQGFAALSPERRAEIARAGGKKAHANGTAHTWDSETARQAGRIGGKRSRRRRKNDRREEVPHVA